MRQVFKGKNPKALSKNSEIWYHTKLSNERLSRVAKGHKFWGVISNPATEGSPPGAGGVMGESAFESSYGDSTYEQPLPLPHDPFQAATAAAKEAAEQAKKQEQLRLQRKFRVLNGMRFDISNQSTVVHYGMSFVIMNTNEEVMSVDRDMKVKIKPLQHVKPSDRVLFKLLDLNEVTNPGPVSYGRPMWFQVWDSDLSATMDFVLGSKVAELPSTSAIKLPGLEGIEEEAAKEKEDNAASNEALKTRAAAVEALSRAVSATSLQGSETAGGSRSVSRANSAQGSRGGGGMGRGDSTSMRGSRATSTRSVSMRGLVVEDDEDEEGEGEGEGEVGEETGGGEALARAMSHRRSVAVTSATAAATVAGGLGGPVNQPAVVRKAMVVEECGGLQAVAVTDKGKVPDGQGGGATGRRASGQPEQGGYGSEAGSGTNLRYHTKSSFYLGKWTPRPAAIPATTDQLLKTNMPIYMEQDIYCLAASLSNSAISQWPRRFEDFADERMLSELNLGTKKKRADDRREGAGRGSSRAATMGTSVAAAAITAVVVREGKTFREGEAVRDLGLAGAVSFSAGMDSSSTPAHTPRGTPISASASTPVPASTPKVRLLESNRSRGNSAWPPTGGGTGSGGSGVSPRTDALTAAPLPLVRSRADLLASLPVGAFRPTVPALYVRPGSSASVDSFGTGGNTATNTVDTADSRFAADVEAAAALMAGAGTADATAAARAALSAQAQQHATTSQLAAAGTDGYFGCVRKIVLRGPPYEMSVDKRCVWRLCVVEDVSSKNDDDFLAAKVMQRARKALQKSEDFRRGGTEHTTGKAGMVPIKGGEAFSRSLRLDTTATNYQGETLMLHPVRQKEVRPREHFEDIMFGAEFMRGKRAGEVKAREDEARDFGNVFMRISHQARMQGVGGVGIGYREEGRSSSVGLGQSQVSSQLVSQGQGQGQSYMSSPSTRHGSVGAGVGRAEGGDRSTATTPPQGRGRDRGNSSAVSVSTGHSQGRHGSRASGGGVGGKERDRDDAMSVASNVTGLASDTGNGNATPATNTNRILTQGGINRSLMQPPAPLFCSAATCGALSIAAMDGDELDGWERRALALLSDRPLDVLVVDDGLSERLALCELLRAEGHTAFEAINGQDAVEKYARLHVANHRYFGSSSSSSALPSRCVLDFDCVVVDLVMPEMDGPTAVAQLRAMGYGGIVLGMVAPSGAAAGLEVFKAYGADEVLLKPVALHTFHLAMVGLLAQRLREDGEAGAPPGTGQRTGPGRSARGPFPGGGSSSVSVASHGSAGFSGGVGAGGSLATYGASLHSVGLQASGLGRHRPGSVSDEAGGVDSLKEIFSDCVSFGERVTSLRGMLSDVGARVEDSVRLAFEEQKRREALELTKLKKAGHLVVAGARGVGAVAGGESTTATALTSPPATGAGPLASTAAVDLPTMQRMSISLPHGDSAGSMMAETTVAAREALARERERLTLLRKKVKMEEADDHIQQAMSHKEKMKKYMIAQDFYDKREKVQQRRHGGGMDAEAGQPASSSSSATHSHGGHARTPRSAGH